MAISNIGATGGGFQVSPGVNWSEVDQTTSAAAVATTVGAIAGVYRWGPVETAVLVDSQNTLGSQFGKPTNLNAETWFTGANFLDYTKSLYVVRAGKVEADPTDPTASLRTAVATVDPLAIAKRAVITANSAVVLSGGSGYVDGGDVSVVDPISGSPVIIGTFTATAIVNNAGGAVTAITLANNVANLVYGFETTPDISLSGTGGGGSFSVDITSLGSLLALSTSKNTEDYLAKQPDFVADVLYTAKYPGELGNSLKISVCDSASAYSSNVNLSGTLTLNVGSTSAIVNSAAAANSFVVGDRVLVGNNSIGKQYLKITGVTANSTTVVLNFDETYKLSKNYTATSVTRYWEYYSQVSKAPGRSSYVANYSNNTAQDELHVVVVDENGLFTGSPGTILEVFSGISRATDSKTLDGATNYYKSVINDQSKYIWFGNDRAGALSGTASSLINSTNTKPLTISLYGGADGYGESDIDFADLARGYDIYQQTETIDIALLLTGKSCHGVADLQYAQLPVYLIDNIAHVRKDCVVFVSPNKETTVSNFDGTPAEDVVAFRNKLPSTSYAVLDSGYKYMYDKYNDIYRWVPLNGDIAGLAARTDNTNDPWYSPAGVNRGIIKNVIKLSFNPTKADRDLLYQNGVNPVVTFPGQGTMLYGDKTLLANTSAFDRINVRRLFIILEKAIAVAARSLLFEFNDTFTQLQFKNLVEPYLRDIQGRRGIYDYLVVCDSTNNTPDVVDSNRFVGDIYIKPTKSINYIQLNFNAVRSGVTFTELTGAA